MCCRYDTAVYKCRIAAAVCFFGSGIKCITSQAKMLRDMSSTSLFLKKSDKHLLQMGLLLVIVPWQFF